MNFRLAASLDVYAGRLILKIISRIPPYPKKISQEAEYKKILVLKFWGIGSILEATPLLKAIVQRYPDISMDLLTFSDNKQMAESLGLFQKIHTIGYKKGFFTLFFQTIKIFLFNRKKYSLIIDLEFFASFSAIMTKMLNTKYSLGFESFYSARNRCYSRTVIFDHSNHVRVIFLKMLDALYIERPANIILSAPHIPEQKKSSVIMKYPELEKDHIKIAININSSELSLNRRWPEQSFRKLIAYIQNDLKQFSIYLVGAKGDVPVVDGFYDLLPNKKGIYNTAGQLDILEFTHALSKMTCLITNDSGPVHVAEAVGTPTVSFFGPETPNLYGPVSDRNLVFYKNLFCSPCLNTYNHKRSKCKDNQCLKLILPEDVYKKMKEKYLL